MKISIAMAVYNGTNYLNEQLASFVEQTALPDELIVVDDCSTDDTIAVLEQFERRAPFPVTILRNEVNSGSTLSFGKAMTEAKGEFIFLSDHDDIWMPDKVERTMNEFAEYQDLNLVFSNAELVDSEAKPLGRLKFNDKQCDEIIEATKADRLVELILRGNVVGGATSAFRGKLKSLILPISNNTTYIHDGWIGLVLGSVGKTHFISEPTMLYRQHQKQQIGRLAKSQNLTLRGRSMYSEATDKLRGKMRDQTLVLNRLEALAADTRANPILLRAIQAVSESIASIPEGIAHFEFRSSITSSRPQRIFPVMRELRSGRYHKYSRGVRSAVKDLLTT